MSTTCRKLECRFVKGKTAPVIRATKSEKAIHMHALEQAGAPPASRSIAHAKLLFLYLFFSFNVDPYRPRLAVAQVAERPGPNSKQAQAAPIPTAAAAAAASRQQARHQRLQRAVREHCVPRGRALAREVTQHPDGLLQHLIDGGGGRLYVCGGESVPMERFR